jgi:hypothetical protein
MQECIQLFPHPRSKLEAAASQFRVITTHRQKTNLAKTERKAIIGAGISAYIIGKDADSQSSLLRGQTTVDHHCRSGHKARIVGRQKHNASSQFIAQCCYVFGIRNLCQNKAFRFRFASSHEMDAALARQAATTVVPPNSLTTSRLLNASSRAKEAHFIGSSWNLKSRYKDAKRS